MLADGKHRPGSVKMGYYALKFLFTQIYHKEWAAQYLPTPKTVKTLPLVLSKDEVVDVLSSIQNFKHRVVIMFIYWRLKTERFSFPGKITVLVCFEK